MSLKNPHREVMMAGARVISGLWSVSALEALWKERAMGSDGRAGSRSSLTLWGISEKAR